MSICLPDNFLKLPSFPLLQPESYYHGTVNIGDTMAIGIQKYNAATKIEKLFYKCTYYMQGSMSVYDQLRTYPFP